MHALDPWFWQRKISYLIFALILSIFFCAQPASVRADGAHGDPSPSAAALGRLTFRGFRLELLTAAPLSVGENNKIIVKVHRADTLAPVRDGIVFVAATPNGAPATASSELTNRRQPARAFEDVWAGSYTVPFLPEQEGEYAVRVNLLKLGATEFEPPELLEFHLNIGPAVGWLSFLPWLLAALGIAAAGTIWSIARSRSPMRTEQSFNLLEIAPLKRLILWRGFPFVLQAPVLALALLIALLGIFDTSDGARNLATRLTWIIWWPGIILTFVLFGRFWCVVCPFGTLNDQAAKLTSPTRRLPRSLRALWVSTALFLLLTWSDEQLGIIRSPRMTAALILLLALAAVGTGLFFQRRSFCRYLCPITGMQGLYSMLAPIELRVGDQTQCHEGCRQACYRGTGSAAGCPMTEFPATMERNTYCNFCFECIKACPKDNWVLRLRTFGKDLWASSHRSIAEGYLAFVLVGVTAIVTAQMLPLWGSLVAILSKAIPVPIRTTMKPVTYLTLTETLVFFSFSLIVVPLIGFVAAWVANRWTHGSKGTKSIWLRFAYMFVPVALAMHLAHNLSHILLEAKSLIPATQSAVSRFASLSLGGAPVWRISPVASPNVVSFLQMSFVLMGLIISVVVGYRLAWNHSETQRVDAKALIPFIVAAFSLTLLNLYLLNQPMGARHGM